MKQQQAMSNIKDNIIFIGFADNKIPEFKEVSSKDYIMYGEDNKFLIHLLYLYNKSSNHSAIVNGKVKYIYGKGLEVAGTKMAVVNKYQESINKVLRKIITDTELFGGYYLEIIWKMAGTLEVYHMPFQCLRKAKDGKGFYYKKNWMDYREKERFIPDFDPLDKRGAQIYAYKEYRAGNDIYPMPGYFAALNDIETDVEISKYNLSVIKQGMFSSKMITFYNGDPGEEAKKKLEKGFKDKFTGSDKAGNVMLVFNDKNGTTPTVEDLSTTDLDKLFDQLNKTTQAEIFTGHEITSPMLFGVKTEGQLGGRSELETAFEIFKNTYVNFKQESIEESISFLYPYFDMQPLKLQSVDFIGFKLSDEKLAEIMPKEWVWEKIGYAPPVTTAPVQGEPMATNENVKNMTGRQFQNLNRVITKYRNGKLDKAAATLLLRNSFGLSDEDIETLLTKESDFEADYTEDDVVMLFEAVGEPAEDYVVVKSKPYQFEKDEFADIKQTDSDILDLIRKDKRITPDIIASVLRLKPAYVSSRIKSLEKEGVLVPVSKTIGIDTIIERAINTENIDTRAKPETIDVYIKYAYEAKPGLEPVIETTRPFCKKMISMNKIYTRAEIESISQRAGFSVWDRKGGFWGSKEECRHRWVKVIVLKKNK